MKIQESAENYLEAILILNERIGRVRSIDVANELGFSRPSISTAMKQFRENGYINVDAMGYITLTDAGLQIAERVYQRHRTLRKLLMAIGVEATIAHEDACKLEHVLSEESYERICEYYKTHIETEEK